ncbi:MAG: flagellar hook-basal body complex protein FliE [Synergistetes bacterium]|nr:flagellar hook-basal body complex protein FliE [Synergistota bacterium]
MVEKIILSLDKLRLPTPPKEKEEKGKGEVAPAREEGFLALVEKGLKKVNELEKNADRMAEKLATGEIDDVHQVAIAVQKAELAVRLLSEIRNRLVEAYQRLTRLT